MTLFLKILFYDGKWGGHSLQMLSSLCYLMLHVVYAPYFSLPVCHGVWLVQYYWPLWGESSGGCRRFLSQWLVDTPHKGAAVWKVFSCQHDWAYFKWHQTLHIHTIFVFENQSRFQLHVVFPSHYIICFCELLAKKKIGVKRCTQYSSLHCSMLCLA